MSNISEEASPWSLSRKSFEHTEKITASRAAYAVKKETQTGTLLMGFEFRLCIVNAHSKANHIPYYMASSASGQYATNSVF